MLTSAGHDEYWSRQQYDHVMAAVQAEVNVAFLSGNTCCFVAPFFPSALGTAALSENRATAPIRSMCFCPQWQIARSARLRDWPYSVSEYSTLGGTVG